MISCSARALMTVASMPMWCAVTSSIPRRADMSAPRTRFPPPTTIATCTPCAATSFTSCATKRSTAASRPARPSPERASPLSFSRMRSYLGVRAVVLFSELEPGEPPDLNIFAQSGDRLGDDVAHVPALVPDEWLLQHRQVARQMLELFRARHKVGFAVHFDDRAHATTGMDVGFHQSFGGGPPGLLGRRGQTLGPQELRGFV